MFNYKDRLIQRDVMQLIIQSIEVTTCSNRINFCNESMTIQVIIIKLALECLGYAPSAV